MKDTPLSLEEIEKVQAKIKTDGLFGAIEAICEINKLRNNKSQVQNNIYQAVVEGPLQSEKTNYQQVVEVPNINESGYRPTEVNSVINEDVRDLEGASIYRDTAIDLVEQDKNSSSLNRGRAKVLTNPSVPSGVPKSVGTSNFADAQIVTPGSNKEKNQVL